MYFMVGIGLHLEFSSKVCTLYNPAATNTQQKSRAGYPSAALRKYNRNSKIKNLKSNLLATTCFYRSEAGAKAGNDFGQRVGVVDDEVGTAFA